MIRIFMSVLLAGYLSNSICAENKANNNYDAYLPTERDIKDIDTSRTILEQLLNRDISNLWLSNFRDFTLGYIGDNYQRFFIRILNVTKDKKDKRIYLVSGKTRVRNNICDFSGTFRLKKASAFKDSADPSLKRGCLIGEYTLYEGTKQSGSGILSGEFSSGWFIDSLNRFYYDSLNNSADSYYNNSFCGIWKAYNKNVIKKCNWGDFRIPFSGSLDEGTGIFIPNEKWVNQGWETYLKAIHGDSIAQKFESVKWWELEDNRSRAP